LLKSFKIRYRTEKTLFKVYSTREFQIENIKVDHYSPQSSGHAPEQQGIFLIPLPSLLAATSQPPQSEKALDKATSIYPANMECEGKASHF
jgi:hypothetical protein